MNQGQLDQLIAALTGMAGGGAAGTAAVMGQMPPCVLGKDKVKRIKKFEDWLKDAETKMSVLNITDGKRKINFLRSCAGYELIEFWEKEARIRFTDIPANADLGIDAANAHTYAELVDVSKKALLKLVNRDRAIIDLLRVEQKDRSFMDFLADVEDQERLCRADEQRITSDDLKRMALIAGMKDRTLAEKAIGEEFSLKQVIQVGLNKESSRSNVDAMQNKKQSTVNRVNLDDEEDLEGGDIEAQINHHQASLKELVEIQKLRRSGKYSGRYKPDPGILKKKCPSCTYEHSDSRRCPAEGRQCDVCKQEGHFAKSSLCKENRRKPPTRPRNEFNTRRLEDENTEDSGTEEEDTIARLTTAMDRQQWPGVSSGARGYYNLSNVEVICKMDKASKWVPMNMGGHNVNLFCDTGSRLTIIPPTLYRRDMGKVVPADCHLRAWGSQEYLDTKGMFHTKITTACGAEKNTWVYVVDGVRPEPLLGEEDAEYLGIIKFNPNGEKRTTQVRRNEASIPSKLRNAGMKLQTEKLPEQRFSNKEKKATMKLVDRFTGSVFSDRVGCLKSEPVKLQYEPGFRPVQPPRYQVPFQYREKLSAHLNNMRRDDVIEDVDPAEPIDCVLNVCISEKKTEGAIRMNIDARPYNIGAKHTKYHVPLPQEIRHQLAGAEVFSELDMGNGFHQVQLDKESQVVFQTHEGIHRMKRLFFGPKNSSGIFHHQVQKAFSGVEGCTTIHDNILIHGKDIPEHNHNFHETMKRAKERGITLKIGKSTFCSPEVKWFGRIFSSAGVSADKDKIEAIVQAGRPENVEDVRSLLQAAAYNAKFAFDHKEDLTYEEVTAPLRELMEKGARFEWNNEREASYQKLLRMMNDKTILAPFIPGRDIHLVTDASPQGIAASLYQTHNGVWRPVDHVSRALSEQEKRWESQIDWESLAKVFGMKMFRHFLIGNKFTAWTDHQPIVPFYSDMTKQAPARVAKHRSQIIDLEFEDKYLPGKKNPTDYNSRHPMPIEGLTKEDRDVLMIDDGQEVTIMKVIFTDLPTAVSEEIIKEAGHKDPTYKAVMQAVKEGRKPVDRSLKQYTNASVWPELSVIDDILCRGERIVVPSAHLPQYGGNIRDWVVEIGHSSHMGMNTTKRLLRHRLWFPEMDKTIEREVSACQACQATVDDHQRDPLQPNMLPKEPWSTLYTDHWGPTRDNKHILVVIDATTKYPEAVQVKGTSAENNIQAFSDIFSRHGVPKFIRSDNGAPFNGKDSHLLQVYFRYMGVKHLPNISAEDPESSGQAEAFMKHLKKVFHTAEIEKKDPYLTLNEHLMQYRATPHPSTGKSPAELLFGRKFRVRLPDIRTNPATDRQDLQEARVADLKAKLKMKRYKDAKGNVREHKIKQGDLILLKRKTTKHRSPFDPDPFIAIHVNGTQIQGERDGTTKTRDAQRWKKLNQKTPKQEQAQPQRREDPDIGLPKQRETPNMQHQAAEDRQEEEPVQDNREEEDIPDIRELARDNPLIINAPTIANRPRRSTRKRSPPPTPRPLNRNRSRGPNREEAAPVREESPAPGTPRTGSKKERWTTKKPN